MIKARSISELNRCVQNTLLSVIFIFTTGFSISTTTSVININQLSFPNILKKISTNSIVEYPINIPEHNLSIISSSELGSSPTPTPVPLDSQKWGQLTPPFDGPSVAVFQIVQAENGTFWFTAFTSDGVRIYHYDLEDWTVYDPQKIQCFHHKSIYSMAIDPNGVLWFGTHLNEIVSFDGNNWSSQTVEEGGYRENPIETIIVRKGGELCAVSNEGMSCRLNEEKWVHHPIFYENEEDIKRIHNAVLSTTNDIWVSLFNGWLYQYNEKNWNSSQISLWMRPIASGSNGSLWILQHEGLTKLDVNGEKNTIKLPFESSECSANVMYEDTNGTLWIGCSDGSEGYQIIKYTKNGIFETVDNQMIKTEGNPSLHNKYPFGHVYSIFQSKDGHIWFGTDHGVFCYHN